MKKNKQKEAEISKLFNSIFDNEQARLSYCYAIIFIQTYYYIMFKRKYLNKNLQINKYLLYEYLPKNINKNFDYLDFGKSFIKSKFNNILSDDKMLEIFNKKYNFNEKTLDCFFEKICFNALNNNQVDYINNFIKK